MKKSTIYLGLLLFAFLFSGCKLMYRTLLGVDTQPNIMSTEKIAKKSKRYGVDQNANYTLRVEDSYIDTVKAYVTKAYDSLDTLTDAVEIARLRKNTSNDLQPVQLRYFNAEGKAIFKMVNCYVDPPIPMKWNVEGSLDQFPPKTPDIKSLKEDVNQDLDFFLPYIVTSDEEELTMADLPNADYYVIIFWNSFFIRPSKKLIKQVKRYHKKHEDENIHVIYVNNHNAHLWGYLTEEQKETVKEEIENAK